MTGATGLTAESKGLSVEAAKAKGLAI